MLSYNLVFWLMLKKPDCNYSREAVMNEANESGLIFRNRVIPDDMVISGIEKDPFYERVFV